jgi:sigma-E factor negative regulatory protein RseB
MVLGSRGGLPLLLLGLCLLGTAALTARAQSVPDLARAAELLERMSGALRSLNYQGTLVYLADNRPETLHLVHRIEGDRVQERLVSLSGPVRALTRAHEGVTCVMPDGHQVQVARPVQGHLAQPRPIDPRALTDRYSVTLAGSERVAGRDTDLVQIRPLDDLRYGYRFYLDRATGLPLRSDLIDRDGEAVEQLLFTTIDLDPHPAGPVPLSSGDQPGAGKPPPRWRFEAGPAGFELVLYDLMEDPRGTRVEHFVFSDQLSSYSIYVEGDNADGLDGVTRIGAVHAAGRVVDGHRVTAVGEVPAATVAAAVAAIRSVPSPAP